MLSSQIRLAIRPIPLSSIPPHLIRLPPTSDNPSTSKSSNAPGKQSSSSPTIDNLLKSFAKRANDHQEATTRAKPTGESPSEDGRGLGNAVLQDSTIVQQAAAAVTMPPNLRIEQSIPKRREYSGVKSAHRSLLQRLRREA